MPKKMSKRVPRKTRKRPVKKSKKNSYRNFVKKMTPVLRKQNPGLKQPNIMKLIAAEWRKQ